MVCGTMYDSGNVAAAGGMWMPTYQGNDTDFKCAWEAMGYNGMQQFYGSWSQSFLKVEELMTQSPQSSQKSDAMSSQNSDATSEISSSDSRRQARKPQTASRAAKRQRGRERRRMFRASAQVEKMQNQEKQQRIEQSQEFESRATAAAAELHLVVRRTFFDVDEPDECLSGLEDLPCPFFKSTSEINEWRLNYRRFRMGHHRGATGEITAFALSSVDAIPWQRLVSSSGPQAAIAA